jgi:hypothetical protein
VPRTTPGDTIRPRLEALGADLDRVFPFGTEDAAPSELLSLPGSTAVLEDLLEQTRAQLVVLDPITAFLKAGVLTAGDQRVRSALEPLARLAERHTCTVLLVRHLTKQGGRRAIYRGAGAIGLAGACRSCLLAARDAGDAERCVLAQIKNNCAALQAGLAYQMVESPQTPPALHWLGPNVWSGDQLVAAGGRASLCPRRVPCFRGHRAYILDCRIGWAAKACLPTGPSA